MTAESPGRLDGDFDAEAYWTARLDRDFSLAGVGWLGIPEEFNLWMYRVRRRVFLRAARDLIGDPGGLDVLDVGSGTGFWVDVWRELGAGTVVGSDLTGVAVERLRRAHPDGRFIRLDIGSDAPGALPSERFDAISAIDVLFHITDDAAYRVAFRNLSALLRPGGLLFFSENLLPSQAARAEHQVSRTRAAVGEALREAGLVCLRVRPLFVLMNNPVASRSRPLGLWWEHLSANVRRGPRVAWALGAALHPLELALTSVRRGSSSTSLVVCRRDGP